MFCFCRLFFPLYVSGIFMLHHSQNCRFLIPPFTQQFVKSGDSPNPFLPFFLFPKKEKPNFRFILDVKVAVDINYFEDSYVQSVLAVLLIMVMAWDLYAFQMEKKC